MRPKIVFLDEYSVNDSDLSSIKKLGDYTGYVDTEERQIVERCKDANIVVLNKIPMKAEYIAELPNVKLICIAATGINNIDLEATEKAGIKVMNAKDYSTFSVAEQTFAGVLALYKQIVYFDEYVKSGRYADAKRPFDFTRQTYELHGKKWGIIGMGNIGKRVASIASAFGCEICYYSTSGRNNDAVYRRVDLDELLRESDIVSVHAPLSKETYHLIDKEKIKLMKPTAIIANMARGSLIAEQALAEALNNDLIAGAAIDVYSKEPVTADNPVYSVRDKYKLVLTPHSAFATKEALQNVVERIAENIREFLSDL